MSPERKHAVIASAVLVPAIAYELVEVAQGDDGWPYSRFMRLMPPAAFTATLAVAGGLLWTHIVKPLARRTLDAVATAVEVSLDDLHDVSFETEEIR